MLKGYLPLSGAYFTVTGAFSNNGVISPHWWSSFSCCLCCINLMLAWIISLVLRNSSLVAIILAANSAALREVEAREERGDAVGEVRDDGEEETCLLRKERNCVVLGFRGGLGNVLTIVGDNGVGCVGCVSGCAGCVDWIVDCVSGIIGGVLDRVGLGEDDAVFFAGGFGNTLRGIFGSGLDARFGDMGANCDDDLLIACGEAGWGEEGFEEDCSDLGVVGEFVADMGVGVLGGVLAIILAGLGGFSGLIGSWLLCCGGMLGSFAGGEFESCVESLLAGALIVVLLTILVVLAALTKGFLCTILLLVLLSSGAAALVACLFAAYCL